MCPFRTWDSLTVQGNKLKLKAVKDFVAGLKRSDALSAEILISDVV
jgi:hypothetical protein